MPLKRLLEEYTVDCVTLTKARRDDPVGGYTTEWTEGAHFQAAWEFQGAPQMTVAEQQGISRVYRIYVDKNINLDYHEVFRRTDNGQTYRVTNPGQERHTPATSRLNKRVVEVEKYDLPTEE